MSIQNKHIYTYLLTISLFISFSSVAFAQETSEKQNRLNFLNLSGYKVRSVVTKTISEPVPEVSNTRKPEERYKIVEVTPTKTLSKPTSTAVQKTAPVKVASTKLQIATALSNNVIKKAANKPSVAVISKAAEPIRHFQRQAIQPGAEINEPVVKPAPVIEKQVLAKAINTKNEESELNIADYPVKEPLNAPLKDIKHAKEPNLLSVFFSLIFVILLAPLLALAYKKLKGVKALSTLAGKLGAKKSDQFNLLNTTSLGQGKNVHLIEINGKRLVVGSTDSNINLLTEISDEESFDEGTIKEKVLNKASTKKEFTSPEPELNTEFIYPENYEYNYADIYKEYLQKNESEAASSDLEDKIDLELEEEAKPKTRRPSARKVKK